MQRAVAAAGGWWSSHERDPDVAALVSECRRRGVRALELWGPDDIGFLGELGQLEFLNLSGMAHPDLTGVNGLARLRGLWVDAYTGTLDTTTLPALEWLSVTEAAPGQLEPLFTVGHPRLHHLTVGKYRGTDLAPVTSLPLVHLAVSDSRSLTGMFGDTGIDTLRAIEVAYCPKLPTLEGVGGVAAVESVSIEACNRIDDLSPLLGLSTLRSVTLEQRTTPDLSVLATHPTLEHLLVIGTGLKGYAEALLSAPALRSLGLGRDRWARIDGEMRHLGPDEPNPHEDERLALLRL